MRSSMHRQPAAQVLRMNTSSSTRGSGSSARPGGRLGSGQARMLGLEILLAVKLLRTHVPEIHTRRDESPSGATQRELEGSSWKGSVVRVKPPTDSQE
jgi:hypothetical protein